MEKSPEEVLLEELASTKKSVKVAAIVKAAKLSRDPKVLEALQALATTADKEIALYAKNAVSRLQLAMGQKTSADTGEITPERLLKSKSADARGILQTFREGPEKLGEEIRPLMAEFLKKYGGPQDAEIVEKWLAESSGNLVVPYLEALAVLDSKKLVAVLPAFLASEHPFVRSRAIVTLDRIDPGEALVHLSELLGSDNAEERLAGVQIAFSFPFKDVSFLIMTLLTEEADPDVIQGAAVLLLSNPETEIALRLLELREAQPEPRKTLITKLLGQLCKTLVAVGLLDEASATPEALKEKFNREGLDRYLADLEIQISLGDPDRIEPIVAWLTQNKTNPQVEAFIAKLGASPATEEIYRRVCPALAPESAIPVASVEGIGTASPEEKVRFLKALPKEISAELSAWIRKESETGEDQVRALALKALLMLAPGPDDAAIAEKNLGHVNPMVASRAISLLEKLDSKKLAAQVPALLTSSDPFICSRAAMIALRYQEGQAVKTLSQMLRSEKPAIRAQAVGCLMICPFEKFSTFIFEALPRETNVNIAKGLLLIVLSNPSPEGLAGLDALPPVPHQGIAMLVAQVRTNLFKLLLNLGMLAAEPVPPIPGTVAPAKEQLKPASGQDGPIKYVPEAAPIETATPPTPATESPEKKTQLPAPGISPLAKQVLTDPVAKPYAVAGIRNAIRQREISEKRAEKEKPPAKAPEASLLETLGMSPPKLAAAAVLIIGLGYFIFFSAPINDSDIPVSGNTKEGTYEVSKTLKMHVLCTLTGKVLAVEPDKTVKFKIGERVFILEFQNKPPVIIGTEEAEVDLVPYLQAPSGEVFAQCYNFKAK